MPDLDALRERGADRFDPVRFRFIEALARRAAACHGDAKRIIDGKLAKALTEYGERFEQAPARTGETAASPATHRTALADLVDYIAAHLADDVESGGPGGARPNAGAPAELKSLRYFRNTWAKLSVDQQVSEALAQGPKNAGPLNAHLLVVQSLKLMRDVSPDYLNRFMSYVDTLLWLEQAGSGGAPAQNPAVRGEGDKKKKPSRTRLKS